MDEVELGMQIIQDQSLEETIHEELEQWNRKSLAS